MSYTLVSYATDLATGNTRVMLRSCIWRHNSILLGWLPEVHFHPVALLRIVPGAFGIVTTSLASLKQLVLDCIHWWLHVCLRDGETFVRLYGMVAVEQLRWTRGIDMYNTTFVEIICIHIAKGLHPRQHIKLLGKYL